MEKCSKAKEVTEATAESLDEVIECGQEQVKVIIVTRWSIGCCDICDKL